MSQSDLTQLLESWPYEPGRVNARRITGCDGRPKLQLRIDMGVMQMEMEGRPDGKRPEGFESLLAYQLDRLECYVEQSGGPEGFVLSSDECRAMREEAVQYYHRYVGLLALGEHDAVVRDTNRNERLFDLCREYAADDADRTVLEQFRPYVIMMRARAEAEAALSQGGTQHALAAIDSGLAQIKTVLEQAGGGEVFEQANEVQLLRGMRDALVPKLPMSQRVELQERLQAAINAENYELAAVLRDELKLLR
ncbi:MAG: UvrB/UvrC motif-containing protein [Planctomycetes bacterium]|nr:UvrB/UvrC motif-containing protein [Planctomycetota bacterium]